MTVQFPVHQIDEAKRLRADLRLALAQADELLRKAEAVLTRTSGEPEAPADQQVTLRS